MDARKNCRCIVVWQEREIAQAADWLAGNRRFLSLWTMGLNQSAVGTDKNIALISLSLITGKIGKPGCGPFSADRLFQRDGRPRSRRDGDAALGRIVICPTRLIANRSPNSGACRAFLKSRA